MSVTIEFKNNDEGGGILKVLIPYIHGDFVIKAHHTSCVLTARRCGKSYIDILEKQRLLGISK